MALAAMLALAIVIGLLTLLPGVGDGAVPGSDKTHHFIAFLALPLPLAYASPRLSPWTVLGATAYGGAIALIQPSVRRDRDIWHFLADGAVAGAAVGVSLDRLRRRAAV